MSNHLGLGNLGGLSNQDMAVLQQAFQQAQQVSLHQQLQNYMELLHSSAGGLNAQKSPNVNNVQMAQLFQVNFFTQFPMFYEFFHEILKTSNFFELR